MKRASTLIGIILIVVVMPLSAGEGAVSALGLDEVPGAYAVYRDSRGAIPAYLGLCYLGGNELAIRRWVPSSGEEYLLNETWYVRDEAGGSLVEAGSMSLIRGKADETLGALIGDVALWLQVWFETRARFADSPRYEAGERNGMVFEYWVPIARLRSVSRGGEPAGSGELTLVTVGVLASTNDPAFYAYRGEPARPAGAGTAIVASGGARKVPLDGLTVSLDANWTAGQDGSYRVSGAGGLLARLAAEPLEVAGPGPEPGISDAFGLIRLLVIYSSPVMIADSLRVFVHAEYPCLFYRSYDPVSGVTTARYRTFVPRGGSSLVIVTLSVEDATFARNREYFESIFFGGR